jgi:hypothetical protein
LRRLILVAPPTLANSTVQQGVIDNGVDMNEPECVVATTKAADGTIQTAAVPSLNIPIYFQGSIIVLPIRDATFEGVTISDDGNCIGSVNVNALSAACDDQYTGCSKWLTAGALTGYVTLDQANDVQVLALGSTLCSLLTSPPDTSGPLQPGPGGAELKSCTVDGGVVVDRGNYCSKLPDGGAGPATATCADSVWLAATFAASAVHINDGTGVPDCTGGAASPGDAGAD